MPLLRKCEGTKLLCKQQVGLPMQQQQPFHCLPRMHGMEQLVLGAE